MLSKFPPMPECIKGTLIVWRRSSRLDTFAQEVSPENGINLRAFAVDWEQCSAILFYTYLVGEGSIEDDGDEARQVWRQIRRPPPRPDRQAPPTSSDSDGELSIDDVVPADSTDPSMSSRPSSRTPATKAIMPPSAMRRRKAPEPGDFEIAHLR